MRLLSKLKGSHLTRDLSYVFLSQIIIMICAFALNKIVSISAGVEGYGLYNLINKFAYILNSFMAGGVVIALPRALARYSYYDSNIKAYLYPSALRILIGYTVLFGLIIIINPSFFSEFFFKENGLYYVLLATFLKAFVQAYGMINYSYFQGCGNYKMYNKTQIVADLLLVALSFVARAELLKMIFVSYSFMVLFHFFVMKKWILKGKGTRVLEKRYLNKASKSLAIYGFPRMVHKFIFQIQNILPSIIILHKLTYNDVGLFAAGMTVKNTIAPIFAITSSVLLQRISLYQKKGDLRLIQKIMTLLTLTFLVISILGVIAILVFDRLIILFLFSNEFIAVTEVLIYFALSIIPSSLHQLFCSPLDALSKTPYNLYTVIISTVIFLFMLFRANSIYACSRAYLYCSIISCLLTLFFWHKEFSKIKRQSIHSNEC